MWPSDLGCFKSWPTEPPPSRSVAAGEVHQHVFEELAADRTFHQVLCAGPKEWERFPVAQKCLALLLEGRQVRIVPFGDDLVAHSRYGRVDPRCCPSPRPANLSELFDDLQVLAEVAVLDRRNLPVSIRHCPSSLVRNLSIAHQ